VTTVPHGKRSGPKRTSALVARLAAGVGIGCVLCAPVFAQDLANSTSANSTGDETIWADTGNKIDEADATGATDGSSAVDASEIDDTTAAGTSRTSPAAPADPVQGSGGTPEDDPYAAPGIPVGSFILRPTLDVGLTGQRENGVNSLLGDSALRLDLNSDWARHELTVTAEGQLQKTLNSDGLDPEFAVDATGRFDLGASTTLTATFGYSYQQDDPQSAAFIAATDPALIPVVTGVNDPVTQVLQGSLSLRQEFGRLFTEAGVSSAHETYGDAELSDGSVISQSDLDNTTIDGRLRAGIEASAVFAPFIEASYGVRRMDETPDSGGVDRNAVRYGLRVGTGIDLGEKLSGEVSAGYVVEDVTDAALQDIAGVAVDASLDWSPRRGTDVNLQLATSTEPSGEAGDSGAMLYSANLGVTHELRANLTAEAGFTAEYRHDQSSADETTLGADLALTYWFNRFAGMTTRVGHEQVLSPDTQERSKTTTAYLGLRLQR